MDLEARAIEPYLAEGDRVLDVGCANGHLAIRLASDKRVRVRGVDYVPEMIEHARSKLASLPDEVRARLDFDVGDITALDEPANAFDALVVVRVLINLGEWPRQAAAIEQCHRALRPGGLLLLSEATSQGWGRLNEFRREWGLSDIPVPPFNTYLDEERILATTATMFDLVRLDSFASTYYVATRVIKPLLDQALGGCVDVADPDLHWNRWCAQLPAFGDYGTQKLFVLRKRG